MTTFEQRFPDLPRESVDRRARSIATLEAQNIPVNDWLPTIESEQDVEPRSTAEIVLRAVCLLVVALKGDRLESGKIESFIRKFDLLSSFEPSETAFINDPSPSEEQRAAFTWRYEAAHVLFWSLGYADKLTLARSPSNPAPLINLIEQYGRDQLVARAKPRSLAEILDQADLIYRYRWALVNAGINQAAAPTGLNGDTAIEQHQALNWLIINNEWDNIPLDT